MPSLLPTFEQFKFSQGVYVKEPPETFDWMEQNERSDYEVAKVALSQPGMREYLKSYTYNHGSEIPFGDNTGFTLLTSFGDHHSGSSATYLAWNYRYALNDWDAFVSLKKTARAKAVYNSKQLHKKHLEEYIKFHADYEGYVLTPLEKWEKEQKLIKLVKKLKVIYNISYEHDLTVVMIDERLKEIASSNNL